MAKPMASGMATIATISPAVKSRMMLSARFPCFKSSYRTSNGLRKSLIRSHIEYPIS